MVNADYTYCRIASKEADSLFALSNDLFAYGSDPVALVGSWLDPR